ncbi:hypothetical protein AB0M43_14755 [Longispora sp. NPDC051575]|uniref:hypothetical protein n=1 Tax=Longispora sp. NPDC051575 TaxID=3154943 RepID=UPI00343D66FE
MHSRIISTTATALLAGLALVPTGCRTQANRAPTWQDNAVAELHRLRLPAEWGQPRTQTVKEGRSQQHTVEQYYPRHTDNAARAIVHTALLEHGWSVMNCPTGACYTKDPYTLTLEIGACPTTTGACGMWITITGAASSQPPRPIEGIEPWHKPSTR